MATNYVYLGSYDRAVFQEEFSKRFSKNGRYDAGAIPAMFELLTFIERDTQINDMRWAAYMLATVLWETTYPKTVEVAVKNKKGQPVISKKTGKPVVLKSRVWLMTMAPVDEVGRGKGRNYHEPVKVRKLADGSVQVTEQDGDQFSVTAGGKVKALTKKAVMGTADGGAAVKTYVDDTGDEHAYFGRGYVQLTWWSNYATTGAAIGRGLDLLLDPELVKQPEVAYAIMAHGMRTGDGFANRRTFAQYFSATKSNYVGARAMVNGSDHAANIATIAQMFEAILMASRPLRLVPASVPFAPELQGAPGALHGVGGY